MAVGGAVEFSAQVRASILDRDLSRCCRCARPLAAGWHAHHRKLRARGGLGTVENGVALCARCHEAVHRHPELATRDGWQVASWDDPAEVPVRSWRGWILLDADGGWARMPPQRP